MKKIKIFVFILFFLLSGLYVFYIYRDRTETDTVPPVISMESESISVKVDADDKELLKGVTAIDDRDGDVTDSVIIESISSLSDSNTRVVTYAAFDNGNNVSRMSRTIVYEDYSPPKFELSRSLVYRTIEYADVLSDISARDVLGNNLSGQIKLRYADSYTEIPNMEGIYTVKVSVTDSFGRESSLNLNVDVVKTNGNIYNLPEIVLSDYLVYVDRGTPFDVSEYITDITVSGNSMPELIPNITIDTNLIPVSPEHMKCISDYHLKTVRTPCLKWSL